MSDKVVMLNESSLTNIANAIRTKLSSTDSYRPSDMDEAIMSISNSGGGRV